MSTSEVSGKPDEILGGGVGEGKLLMDWHPIQGGVLLTLPVAHATAGWTTWLEYGVNKTRVKIHGIKLVWYHFFVVQCTS